MQGTFQLVYTSYLLALGTAEGCVAAAGRCPGGGFDLPALDLREPGVRQIHLDGDLGHPDGDGRGAAE